MVKWKESFYVKWNNSWLKRVKCDPDFVSPGSQIFKRIWPRKYDPVIMERIFVLCFARLQPWTNLSKNIALWLTRLWVLYDGTCANLLRGDKAMIVLWLLVGTPSLLGPELASRRAEHSLIWRMSYIFWYTVFYHLTYPCNNFMVSPLWLAVGPRFA